MVGAAPLLVGWIALGSIWGGEVPRIEHPVTDLAAVLSPTTEEEIARELVEHREDSGVQLAVLLLDTTEGQTIDDFSQAVFTKWGGGSAQRNDGALFVLAIEDRRSRLHLGYGLEGAIPDATAKRMLDALRPSLQGGHYAEATRQLVAQFRDATGHLEPGEPPHPPRGATIWWWLAVLALGVGLGVSWAIVLRRAREATGYPMSTRLPGAPSKPRKKKSKAKRRNEGNDALSRAMRTLAVCARQRSVQLTGAIVFSAQVAILIAFHDGPGFWLVYSAVFWLFFVLGWITGRGGLWSYIIGTCLFAGIISAGVMSVTVAAQGAPLSGWELLVDASPSLYFLGGFLAFFGLMGLSAARGSGSSSSSSYSSSSYATTSSYSTASYSGGGGSSYSSSSYSGGGGSSGGGGASSSW